MAVKGNRLIGVELGLWHDPVGVEEHPRAPEVDDASRAMVTSQQGCVVLAALSATYHPSY